jgi:hypothetical protein
LFEYWHLHLPTYIDGQSSNLHLNVINYLNTSVN